MGWGETYAEKFARYQLQEKRRKELIGHVSAALLKIQMMGLTFPECMVECEAPEGIHPLRWRAIIKSALQNGIPE